MIARMLLNYKRLIINSKNNGNDSVENVGYIKSGKGVSVAMGDSASVDSMQRTGIDQVSTPTTSPTLLK
jgi:hypothetical protein